MAEVVYPIALKLKGRRVVVVGGGDVAARKVQGLLDAAGTVDVIAPHSVGMIDRLAEDGRLRLFRRNFDPADLDGAALVIAATDDPLVNHAVWQAARERDVWVNVVDDAPFCDFYAPAVIRRGPVVVAVSTGGGSPALAAWLRSHLEKLLPGVIGPLAELLDRFRLRLQQQLTDPAQRAAFWSAVMTDDLVALAENQGAQVVMDALEQEKENWLEKSNS